MRSNTRRTRRMRAVLADGIFIVVLVVVFVAAIGGIVALAVGIATGAIGVLGIAGAVVFVGVLAALPDDFEAARSVRCSRALMLAGRLLPAEVREGYCEEWSGWMTDMREDGVPRIRRWVELLSIVLIAAPRLAVTLRWAPRKSVD